ncbi:MAG TPA: hypothetical protein VL442_07360, partial [Mucilaginibacter sp.]|nr:hypothetical protein [Mucilaginibacter sp.]
MKPKCLLALLFVMASVITAFAQNNGTLIAKAVDQLKIYSDKYPVEKVHLQLDKPYYAAGDDIWFKAYVTSGSRHTLSGISGILNVELIDAKNLVKQYIKLPLVSGLTWGDFKLPDTINAGNYRIRAYTNWMRNAGTPYFYDNTISIGNSIWQKPVNAKELKRANKNKTTALVAETAVSKTDIQFFPESGNLVYGINSKVAFKAVGEDGFGKEVKGIITDEKGQEITRFSSQHLGMGEFILLPVEGKTYKAKVSFADGSEKSISLPVPQSNGYVMHIDNSDPLFIELKIERGKNGSNDNAGGINLVVQSGGEVYYAAQSKSQKSSTTMIPKSKFPSGIAQFTLFSDKGEPLNERLVFIQNPDRINLSSSISDKVFSGRQKMQVDITAKSNDDKPVLGNFSVAVIDETKVPEDEAMESTIFSDLLLTSDIKGYVEKPNYYFTDVNEKTTADLDILMLTQGYHRFEWKQIINGESAPIVYQPETSLQIAGYIKTMTDKPVASGKVSLLSSSAGFFTEDTLSDNKGYFAFKNLQFKDSTKFVVQSKSVNGKKNVKLELDTVGPVLASNDKYLPLRDLRPNDSLSTYLTNSKKVYSEEIRYGIGNHPRPLKEVKITAKKPPILENSSNLNGPGNADQVFLMKSITGGCPTLPNCLSGNLVGVFFKWDQFGTAHPFAYMDGKPSAVRIMLDGIKIDDDIFDTLPSDIVESVEVLRSTEYRSIYGFEGSTVLLLINTKKGSYAKITTPNMATYMPKGYYKAREFYSPQYNDPKTNTAIADLRSTLYWNPNVVTDKDGNASFEYFNTNSKGSYRIVIEGIDASGNLGRQVYRYKVE